MFSAEARPARFIGRSGAARSHYHPYHNTTASSLAYRLASWQMNVVATERLKESDAASLTAENAAAVQPQLQQSDEAAARCDSKERDAAPEQAKHGDAENPTAIAPVALTEKNPPLKPMGTGEHVRLLPRKSVASSVGSLSARPPRSSAATFRCQVMEPVGNHAFSAGSHSDTILPMCKMKPSNRALTGSASSNTSSIMHCPFPAKPSVICLENILLRKCSRTSDPSLKHIISRMTGDTPKSPARCLPRPASILRRFRQRSSV